MLWGLSPPPIRDFLLIDIMKGHEMTDMVYIANAIFWLTILLIMSAGVILITLTKHYETKAMNAYEIALMIIFGSVLVASFLLLFVESTIVICKMVSC